MLDLQTPVTLDLLVFGDDDISYDIKTVPFTSVHNYMYIAKSKRFN